MKDTTLHLTYGYSKEFLKNQFLYAIKNIHFIPQFCVFGYEDDESNPVKENFDYNKLCEYIDSEELSLIIIENEDYSESRREQYKMLKLQVNKLYDTFHITFGNVTDSILKEEYIIQELLFHQEFICGYYFDKSDAFENLFLYRDYEDSNKKKFSVDLYGRMLSVSGIDFVAAPLMWFGKPINNVIDIKKIINFQAQEVKTKNNIEIHSINLFDIDSSPKLPVNRSKQELIWKNLNIESSFKNYSEKKEKDKMKKLGITPDMDLLEYLRIMSRKGKK